MKLNYFPDTDSLYIDLSHKQTTVGGLLVRQIDVKGIGIWEIIQFHGLNLRSRNALCIVSLSESVVTRKKRTPSSSTLPQKRYRSFSCNSARMGERFRTGESRFAGAARAVEVRATATVFDRDRAGLSRGREA